jgi:hypothetical protein
MKRVLVLLLLLGLFVASPVSAHRSGCHRWHSCPSDTGSYTCGDLGYTSGCGYTVPVRQEDSPTNKPLPTIRIITSTLTPTFEPSATPTLEPTWGPDVRGVQSVNEISLSDFFSWLYSLFFGK